MKNYIKAIINKNLILSFIGFLIATANIVIESDILTTIFWTLEILIALDLVLFLIFTNKF